MPLYCLIIALPRTKINVILHLHRSVSPKKHATISRDVLCIH